MAKHILMIVTSVNKMKTDHKETGVWFPEFAEAYHEFEKNNFLISVASPAGGTAPVDQQSLAGLEPELTARNTYLEQTAALTAVENLEKYDAVFLVGGHGVMFDFPDNKDLQRIIQYMFESDKIVAAVCHGPAGLVNVIRSDGKPLVAGKNVTCLTNAEEDEGGLSIYMPFLLESRLRQLGATFVQNKNWDDHIEIDGKLLTGQNPQSTISLAKAVIELLLK